MTKTLKIIFVVALALSLVASVLMLSSCANVEHNHNYGDWFEQPATCETAGQRTRTCKDCGKVQTETIAALGHDWQVVTEMKSATCEEDGLRSAVCSRCDATEEEQVIPALGHDWEIVQNQSETCQHGGRYTYTCKRTICKETKTVTTEAVDHKWGSGKRVEATCDQEGSVTYTCTFNCGTQKVDKLKALGHSFAGDYIVDKAPTLEEAGSKSKH